MRPVVASPIGVIPVGVIPMRMMPVVIIMIPWTPPRIVPVSIPSPIPAVEPGIIPRIIPGIIPHVVPTDTEAPTRTSPSQVHAPIYTGTGTPASQTWTIPDDGPDVFRISPQKQGRI